MIYFIQFFLGPEPTLFGKPKFCCMRLHYRNGDTSGYFHTLRAATRNPEDDGKGETCLCNKSYLNLIYFFSLLRLFVMIYFRHIAVHSWDATHNKTSHGAGPACGWEEVRKVQIPSVLRWSFLLVSVVTFFHALNTLQLFLITCLNTASECVPNIKNTSLFRYKPLLPHKRQWSIKLVRALSNELVSKSCVYSDQLPVKIQNRKKKNLCFWLISPTLFKTVTTIAVISMWSK